MGELILQWYSILNGLFAWVSEPLGQLGRGVDLPLVAAFILGLLGALAPCQLTGNAAAMAYVSRHGTERKLAAFTLGAFILGKVLTYSALGVAFLLLGREAFFGSVPLVRGVRQALGPLFLVSGLFMLFGARLTGGVGVKWAAGLQKRLPQGSVLGAFFLGLILSLAFCPTMFWLFFGLTLPLSMGQGAGLLSPSAFALGTSVPLLLFGGLLLAGQGTRWFLQRNTRVYRFLRPLAAVVFILVGLNDTITYWLL
ncbi:MAG: sulfite exporter TauE/SafE family protein [Chloroflexi bacterium]|nr:sulfite exporter TauE/SafE family protein [Chloroflexota bacterium]